MPVVVLHAIEHSAVDWNAPRYQAINDALSSIQITGPTGDVGGWVGPRPRVTRYIYPGTTSDAQTSAVWPYAWPDTVTQPTPASVQSQLLSAVQRQLGATSSDWRIAIEPYSEAVNGPLADWASGALSVTQTSDQFPTIGGRLDARENPVGPTSAATHPGTVAAAASAGTDKLIEFLKAAWPVAAIFAGVYVANSLGAFAKKAAPKRPRPERPAWIPAGARSNPDYTLLPGPNPRPPAWMQYGPSTPYPCAPWEAGIVGLVVPGRGGGTVTSCATPAEPVSARRRRGQVQIGLPGVGGMMPKARARARIRRAGLEMLRTPIEDVAQAVAAYSGASCPLPYAPGLEFPHTVSRCDPEHKVWAGYSDALAEAQERASIEAPDSAGPEEFDCLVFQALEQHPKFPAWRAAAEACVRGFQSRESSRKGKAAFSTQRERGQARARAIASGVDVTDAEYRDTLRSAERKGRRR